MQKRVGRSTTVRSILLAGLIWAGCGAAAQAQTRLLDNFENLDGWQAIASEGVQVEIAHDVGHTGMGMRVDFNFNGYGGYFVVRKKVDLTLPKNYRMAYFLRARAPNDDLQFKLFGPKQQNVWWINRRNFKFPDTWQQQVIKRRYLKFAWGPAGGGDIHRVAVIEIAVKAGSGGKGSIWLDDLTLTPRPPLHNYKLTPQVQASTTAPKQVAENVLKPEPGASWHSGTVADDQWLQLDFKKKRLYGGAVIDWDRSDFATDYRVQVSDDGKTWRTTNSIRKGNGGRDFLYMPDTRSRYLRLSLQHSSRGKGYGIASITVKPFDFSLTVNRFFEAIAAQSKPGLYPKYLSLEQSYWTIVGVRKDKKEALLNEQGMLEVEQSHFSIEPFLYVGGKLVTWHDANRKQSLADGYLPIPSVTWRYKDLRLTVTPFATGKAGKSVLYARYRLENLGDKPTHAKLYLALRPFQVKPLWQDLNSPGGLTPIHSMRAQGNRIHVNADKTVTAITPAENFGAATFYQGGIADYMQQGTLPGQKAVHDPFGYASGAIAYSWDLPAQGAKEAFLAVPFHAQTTPVAAASKSATPNAAAEKLFADTVADWRAELSRVDIQLPGAAQRIANIVKTTLAYTLINQDGPALQPGSRSYDRAWIRDGALTSASLLRMGYTQPVRAFIEWYAPYQFDSGKVPCYVDSFGANPVPENDSNGEFIYLIWQYYRFTHDIGFLRRLWPHVVRAVDYIDTLRRQEMSAKIKADHPAFYGLMPASISHEGYVRPVHSYWDDFFALLGLRDAVAMARVLDDSDNAAHFAAIHKQFKQDFYASLARTLTSDRIDYIPGSVELGDFDAPSTSIGIVPGGQRWNLPAKPLQNTLDKYWAYFRKRRAGTVDWKNYAPYEMRLIDSFVRLGQIDRAHQLLDYMLTGQRPPAWNEWAEVVWKNPKAPRFIGDMPHTWAGSAFIRAVRDMFVYERSRDHALVLAAGVLPKWVTGAGGVVVKRLPTYYGPLNYKLQSTAPDKLRLQLSGDVTLPPGKIVVQSPLDKPLRSVTVGGKPITSFNDKQAVIDRFPADVVLNYAGNPQ